MPERIPGTNFIKILENEFFVAINGEEVYGPTTIRVLEIIGEGVMVQGTRKIGPDQTEEAIWEVEEKTIKDFLNNVQKRT